MASSSNSGRFMAIIAILGVVIAAGAWLYPDARERFWPESPPSSAAPVDRGAAGEQTPGTGPEWSCPGGTFCAWDGPDGTGAMVTQKGAECRLHDIGSAGLSDQVTSFQNRTGHTVGLYNWNEPDNRWDPLVRIANGQKGNVPKAADNMTDAVKVCDE